MHTHTYRLTHTHIHMHTLLHIHTLICTYSFRDTHIHMPPPGMCIFLPPCERDSHFRALGDQWDLTLSSPLGLSELHIPRLPHGHHWEIVSSVPAMALCPHQGPQKPNSIPLNTGTSRGQPASPKLSFLEVRDHQWTKAPSLSWLLDSELLYFRVGICSLLHNVIV